MTRLTSIVSVGVCRVMLCGVMVWVGCASSEFGASSDLDTIDKLNIALAGNQRDQEVSKCFEELQNELDRQGPEDELRCLASWAVDACNIRGQLVYWGAIRDSYPTNPDVREYAELTATILRSDRKRIDTTYQTCIAGSGPGYR